MPQPGTYVQQLDSSGIEVAQGSPQRLGAVPQALMAQQLAEHPGNCSCNRLARLQGQLPGLRCRVGRRDAAGQGSGLVWPGRIRGLKAEAEALGSCGLGVCRRLLHPAALPKAFLQVHKLRLHACGRCWPGAGA